LNGVFNIDALVSGSLEHTAIAFLSLREPLPEQGISSALRRLL